MACPGFLWGEEISSFDGGVPLKPHCGECMWEIMVVAIFGNYNFPEENSETIDFPFLNILVFCLDACL